MPEESTRSYRKLIFVSLFGLLILGSFLTTSYFYSGLQEKLWKNELTRKAVIAALSFTASPTTEETLNESIQRLKTNLEEINEISIYRRVGAKFQAVASTKQELIGETVTDNQMDLSFEKRMPVPLLEIQKSYDNGNTRESHLVNVYTPLNDSSYLFAFKVLHRRCLFTPIGGYKKLLDYCRDFINLFNNLYSLLKLATR